MTEPWRVSDTHKYGLLVLGLTPDRIEGLELHRQHMYETLIAEQPEYYEDHMYEKYGLDHKCHCLDDKMTDNMVSVTACSVHESKLAFEMLEKVLIERDTLNELVMGLRKQVHSLGAEPLE